MEQKLSFLLHGSSSRMRAGGDTRGTGRPGRRVASIWTSPALRFSRSLNPGAPFGALVQPAVKATDNLSVGATKSPWSMCQRRHQRHVDHRLYLKDFRAGTERVAIGGSSHGLQLGAASCEDCGLLNLGTVLYSAFCPLYHKL